MEYECRKCLIAEGAVTLGEVGGGVVALSEATDDRPVSWQYSTGDETVHLYCFYHLT